MMMSRLCRTLTAVSLLGAVLVHAVIDSPVAGAVIPIVSNPTLTEVRTIRTTPFIGTSTSPRDAEGLAYVPQDNSIWLSDDNRSVLYEIDKVDGTLKRTVTQAQLAAAPQFGGGPPAGVNTADDMEAMAYDAQNDVLYAFAGKCCTSSVRAAVFKLVRSSGVFVVDSYQPFSSPLNDFSGVGMKNGQLYAALGKDLYLYDYPTNSFTNPVNLPVSGNVVGIGFAPDSDDFWVSTSSNRVYRLDGATKQVIPGYDFSMSGLGVLDARAVEVVDDQIFVADGYDSYGSNAPERYAIHVYSVSGTVVQAPVASFTANPTSGTAPLSVQFTDTSTSTPTAWAWVFGDGTTSTQRNPNKTFTTPGSYTVTLTASNSGGSSSASTTITVNQPVAPVASFSATPTGGSAPLAVQFTDTSTNSPTSWAWTFGDGTTSTVQNPSKTFATAGTFTVTLTATNSGGSSSAETTITVSGGSNVATFLASGDAFVNSASPTKNYGGPTYNYIRGLQGYEYRPYVKFDVSGLTTSVTHAVLRLFVTDATDNVGSWYSVSPNWNDTTVTYNTAPAIGGSPVGTTGATVLNTWTEVDVTSIVQGNGSFSFANLPGSTNSFRWSSREGANPPQLVLTLGGGSLPPSPVASFSANPTGGIAPLTVQFTDTSTNSPTAWAWSFGDGTTSTAQSPSKTFTSAGSYTVTLTASNLGGSTSAQTTITVDPPPPGTPVASFTRNPTTGTAPLVVQFTDTSTNSPTSWAWSFGDGTTSTLQNPSKTFASAGSFTVTLTASNTSGSGSTSTTVTVSPPGGGSTTYTFGASDDAFVNSSSPTKNYGTATYNYIRGLQGYEYRPYLKFNVSGVTGSVTNAKVRLFVTDATDNVGPWFSVSPSWSEGSIVFNTAPPIVGSPLATVGAAVNGTWTEIDVTALVTGNGSFSIANLPASLNSVRWSSKEGSNPPQLVVTTG